MTDEDKLEVLMECAKQIRGVDADEMYLVAMGKLISLSAFIGAIFYRDNPTMGDVMRVDEAARDALAAINKVFQEHYSPIRN